jgi:hypothetical protein
MGRRTLIVIGLTLTVAAGVSVVPAFGGSAGFVGLGQSSFRSGEGPYPYPYPHRGPKGAAQCGNGNWRTFGVFKNQGDCVAWVKTGGANAPGKNKPRGSHTGLSPRERHLEPLPRGLRAHGAERTERRGPDRAHL